VGPFPSSSPCRAYRVDDLTLPAGPLADDDDDSIRPTPRTAAAVIDAVDTEEEPLQTEGKQRRVEPKTQFKLVRRPLSLSLSCSLRSRSLSSSLC